MCARERLLKKHLVKTVRSNRRNRYTQQGCFLRMLSKNGLVPQLRDQPIQSRTCRMFLRPKVTLLSSMTMQGTLSTLNLSLSAG